MTPTSPEATLADGTPARLGRYRLLRPISTGGMARVFEGRRESLHGVAPRVAIKVILPEHARDPGFRELFINEARIGSMIQHQNLVQIQDFDADGDRFYLVMEYVEGLTLRRVVNLCRRHGVHIPVDVVAEVGRQVCDGLHHAHTARAEDGHHLQLIHRDLKPSNLMISPVGVVKLLDFGISRATVSRERSGAVRGTWGYMAPEQAAGRQVGPPADMFGLAAVLYEMAALEPLMPEKEPDDIIRVMSEDEPARRASRLTGAHGALSSVLVRALQRDPQARFTTAAAMGRALGSLIPDPITSREELVQFQKTMVGLAGPRERPSLPPSPDSSSGRPVRSDSTMHPAPAFEIGGRPDVLPVGVGDMHRPYGSTPRRGPSGGRRSWLPALAAVAFLVAAIAIVGITAWTVLGGQLSGEPADTEVVAEQPLPSASAESAPAGAAASATPPALPPNSPPAAVDPTTAAAAEPTSTTHAAAPSTGPPAAAAPAASRVSSQPSSTSTRGSSATPTAAIVEAAEETEPVEADAATHTGRGFLTISSVPEAQVVVDGRFIRYSPMLRQEVASGDHLVTLIAEDGRRTAFRVSVPDGDEVRRVWNFDQGAWAE